MSTTIEPTPENNASQEQFNAALEIVLAAIDKSYGVSMYGCTPTPDGSFLGDFPAYTKNIDAPKRMSAILGFEVRGDEPIHELTNKVLAAQK